MLPVPVVVVVVVVLVVVADEEVLFVVVEEPLQRLPLGDEEVISFSLARSCFLNLARLFWNQT